MVLLQFRLARIVGTVAETVRGIGEIEYGFPESADYSHGNVVFRYNIRDMPRDGVEVLNIFPRAIA
jgi:hypothetical protein